ncbi:hypothetical protein A2U01_0090896, partial [Trifolium medium]|nr:hypothetical protein [Trifolium medium]
SICLWWSSGFEPALVVSITSLGGESACCGDDGCFAT